VGLSRPRPRSRPPRRGAPRSSRTRSMLMIGAMPLRRHGRGAGRLCWQTGLGAPLLSRCRVTVGGTRG
jgi:hypothetical protein